MIHRVASLALLGVVMVPPALAQVVKPATPATKPVAPKAAMTKPPTPAAKPPSLTAKPNSGSAAAPAKAMTLEDAQAELASVRARIKTTTGTSMQDMLAMQQLMTRKGQLESMIANTQKASEPSSSQPGDTPKAS